MRADVWAVLCSLVFFCFACVQADESSLGPSLDGADSANGNDTAQALGRAIADFNPDVDGFGFDNWGEDPATEGLTPNEIRRLFGDRVCASTDGGECILTPPAQRWMDEKNEGMNGGHCGGMAITSLLMFLGMVDPEKFGGSSVHDLTLESNEPLQREIALWKTSWYLVPGDTGYISGPAAVLDALENTIAQGTDAREAYCLQVERKDDEGGHAIVPIGVEDDGSGSSSILVYDPNFHDTVRKVEIDRRSDTFSFSARLTPEDEDDFYTGNISLHPVSRRLEVQECPFCNEDAGKDVMDKGGMAGEKAKKYNEVSLRGPSLLLITDKNGRRMGWTGKDAFINEIPGARVLGRMDGQAPGRAGRSGADYLLPEGLNFSIMVDGTWLENGSFQNLTVIGPGYDMLVQDLWLDPGEKDHIDISTAGRMDCRVAYRSNYTESPDIIIGAQSGGADYEFIVRGVQVESGGRLGAELDLNRGIFTFDTRDNRMPGVFGVIMHRIDDYGEQFFGNDDMYLRPNDTIYMDFMEWKGEGTGIPMRIDHGGKGRIDETVELKDKSDFYRDYYKDWEGNSTA